MILTKKIIAVLLAIATFECVAAQDSTTTIGKDSVSTAVGSTQLSKYEMRKQRGISNVKNLFVPPRQWVFGITGTYSTHANDDYKLLIVENINSKGYTIKVSPFVGYSVAPNTVVGFRLAYSRSFTRIDNANINIGSGDSALNFGVDYYYALKHSYDVAAVWRRYIPFGRNKRFAMFSEVQLALGGGESKFAEGSPIRGTYARNFRLSVGVNPGIVAFMTNNSAIELNVGVLGFNYTSSRQVHNQVTVGHTNSSYMNFNINIFSIGVGFAVYL